MLKMSCLICLESTAPISDKSDNYSCECRRIFLHDECDRKLRENSNKCLICKNPTLKREFVIINFPEEKDYRFFEPQRKRCDNIASCFLISLLVSFLIFGGYESNISDYDYFTQFAITGLTLNYVFIVDYYLLLVFISYSPEYMIFYFHFKQKSIYTIILALYVLYLNVVHISTLVVFLNNDFSFILNYCLAFISILYCILVPFFCIGYIAVWCRS